MKCFSGDLHHNLGLTVYILQSHLVNIYYPKFRDSEIQNHQITNVEFYFKRLFNVLEYYDDSDYSDEENIIQDGDKDEEKLNQLLRNIQPEMPKGSIEFRLYINVSLVTKKVNLKND